MHDNAHFKHDAAIKNQIKDMLRLHARILSKD